MIRRCEHSADKKFLLFNRKTAQNKKLSFEARGLLLYVLSKPPKWEAQDADLMREGGIKKFALNSILKELKECGYARRYRERQRDGTFKFILEVAEEPGLIAREPLPDYPLVDEPLVDNQVVVIDSTCAGAPPLTDQRELRRKEGSQKKPRRDGVPPPQAKVETPSDLLTIFPDLRILLPGFNLEAHVKKWCHYYRSVPKNKLRTLDEWFESFQYWMADKTPNGNGATNGKQQSQFESSSERNVRNIRESLARFATDGSDDNHQDPALLLTAGVKSR